MPIPPFLADQAFEPEVITTMSLALERVCDALRLRMIDDVATRLVAEHGEDADRNLCAATSRIERRPVPPAPAGSHEIDVGQCRYREIEGAKISTGAARRTVLSEAPLLDCC
jgi:hypothetical protein